MSPAFAKSKKTQAGRSKKVHTAQKRTAGKKLTSRSTRATRASRQAQPSTQRYTEIQQALVDKGHYSGPVNGVWGPESVAALREFQEQQSLKVDGKLGALTLIALGLGPQRNTTASFAAKPEASEATSAQ